MQCQQRPCAVAGEQPQQAEEGGKNDRREQAAQCTARAGRGVRRDDAGAVEVGARAEVRDCFDMITSRSAGILRLEEYGIKIGVPADLVVIDTDQPETAVAELAPPLYGFKRGRMTFKRAPVEVLRP